MSLTVVRRPRGVRVSETENVSYVLRNDGYGNAVLMSGSGLTHGTTIVIAGSYDSYNGFWYLDERQTNIFHLLEYEDGPALAFTRNATPNVYPQVVVVDWNCVHLPIVYRLESDLYPVDTVGGTRTVTQIENDNGFIKITLNSPFTFEALDWIRIEGSTVDAIDTYWQIITKHSTSQMTIAAPYLLTEGNAYVLGGATIRKYYASYAANIRVYGGLNENHLWEQLKPYELICEHTLPPDESGLIDFNVAEYLKKQIAILSNRPNQDAQPFDLDRFCQFYIEVAESYDVSDGITSTNTLQSYISDKSNFEGWAHDAKLPFRNRYSGFLSEYAMNGSGAEWINGGFGFTSGAVPFASVTNEPFRSALNGISLGTLDIVAAYKILQPEQRVQGTTFTLQVDVFSGDLSGDLELQLTLIAADGTTNNSTSQPVTANGITEITVTDNGFVPYAIVLMYSNNSGSSVDVSATVYNEGTTAKFLTNADQPLYFPGYYFDISAIVNFAHSSFASPFMKFVVKEYNDQGGYLASETTDLTATSNGVYRLPVVSQVGVSYLIVGIYFVDGDDDAVMIPASEEKRIDVNQECAKFAYPLMWRNNLGGFDYWVFSGFADHLINIETATNKARNIFPQWPKSYGENAAGRSDETSRSSRKGFTVRSQNLTQGQVDYIAHIKTSTLVQQYDGTGTPVNVMIDPDSFIKRRDQDDTFSIQFTMMYTDNIPAQSL